MQKGLRYTLIGVGVAATLGLGYFIYSQLKKDKDGQGDSSAPEEQDGKKIWRFTDNHFAYTDFGSGNLGFIGDSVPPFFVGQEVIIQQNSGATYPQYDGKTSIEYIYQENGKWIVKVAKQRIGSTPKNGGIIKQV